MIAIGEVTVVRAAFFSTHHASAADALAGRARAFTAPAYDLLVARARRFTSLVTQLHIEVCGALHDPTAPPPAAVFATCHGEIQASERLIADFRDAAMVSSARFALSVHNAASGVYAVAVGATAPSTTITGANAIAAGWLEAALTVLDEGRPVLLSIADEPVPAVFRDPGPGPAIGVAAAFLLAPAGTGPGRRARLAFVPGDDDLDALRVLADATDAASGDRAATLVLGRTQPHMMLELAIS
jgi:hypothetical protein